VIIFEPIPVAWEEPKVTWSKIWGIWGEGVDGGWKSVLYKKKKLLHCKGGITRCFVMMWNAVAVPFFLPVL
jgi:hypothetical protein